MLELLKQVLPSFHIAGEQLSVYPLKRGHINDTFVSEWLVDGQQKKFVHQRVNHHVFKNVPALMENVLRITEHVCAKLEGQSTNERGLVLVQSEEGNWFSRDSEGNFWRTYEYVADSESSYVCESAALARKAADMCGRFQMHISDLDPAEFHETIPEFHNTVLRYAALRQAVDQADSDRVSYAAREILFALDREEQGSRIVRELKSGVLPARVTHNDLKFNNVMFDVRTGEAVAIVDLDTCMPGSILYDFGDLVRNSSVPANEDEANLSKVFMDISFFEALVEGYFGQVGPVVTEAEWDLISFAPRLMTLTIGVRFLTDYLNGDVYFKTDYPDHNLVRAKNQFKIIRSMEEQSEAMDSIVERVRDSF